jgi:hypothetical protein
MRSSLDFHLLSAYWLPMLPLDSGLTPTDRLRAAPTAPGGRGRRVYFDGGLDKPTSSGKMNVGMDRASPLADQALPTACEPQPPGRGIKYSLPTSSIRPENRRRRVKAFQPIAAAPAVRSSQIPTQRQNHYGGNRQRGCFHLVRHPRPPARAALKG